MIQLQALLVILQTEVLVIPASHKQMADVDGGFLVFKYLLW